MARAEAKEQWVVKGKIDDVIDDVRSFLSKYGFKVADMHNDEILADQGSELWTRMLGGWFVGKGTLPKRVKVSFDEEEGGVCVRAHIFETMGFGWMDPILKGKYERACKEFIDAMDTALPD